jgi:hypothetical protein
MGAFFMPSLCRLIKLGYSLTKQNALLIFLNRKSCKTLTVTWFMLKNAFKQGKNGGGESVTKKCISLIYHK